MKEKIINIIKGNNNFIFICLILWSCTNKKCEEKLLKEFKENEILFNDLVARTTIYQKDSSENKVRIVFTNNSFCKDLIIKNCMDKLNLSYVYMERIRTCKKEIYYSDIYIELKDKYDIGDCYYNYTFCEDQINYKSKIMDVFRIDKNWSLCIEK